MVVPFDQAFHSNNSNADKHINTRKLFIKQSPLSRPFYLTCTNLMRHEKTFSTENKVDNSLVKLHNIMLSTHSDILQWISEETMFKKYISMGYGYACVEK